MTRIPLTLYNSLSRQLETFQPIDPTDVGATYRETVRVNSQSGKGGVGFILESYFGVALPRQMLVEFSRVVQKLTEETGGEIAADTIWSAFAAEYLKADSGPYKLLDYDLFHEGETERCKAQIEASHQQMTVKGEGSGPIEAFVNALVTTLNEPLNIVEFHEHAMATGKDAQAICLIAIDDPTGGVCYGAGTSRNTITASLLAIVSALNRRWSRR